jgi:hypothetical protein
VKLTTPVHARVPQKKLSNMVRQKAGGKRKEDPNQKKKIEKARAQMRVQRRNDESPSKSPVGL